VQVRPLSGALADVASRIDAEREAEGVVARYRGPDGLWRLAKLKSTWYRNLHAIATGLTPKRAVETLIRGGILGPHGVQEDVAEALYRLGLDAEQVAFVRPLFDECRAAMAEVDQVLHGIEQQCRALAGVTLGREAIERIRGFSASETAFHVAIQVLKGRRMDAWCALAADRLQVPGGLLRTWVRETPQGQPMPPRRAVAGV
jgi:hypothetical protein